MKIQLAEHYGLCFGVRDAIAQAEHLAKDAPLTILGELVHNPVVRRRLAEQGVVEAPLDQIGQAPTPQVMITAHGASESMVREWRSAGFGVANGTCPLVRHAHDRLRALVGGGYFPIVIGKHGHVEVRGLTGDFPEAIVVESEADLARLPHAPRLGVVSQTTQPIDRVESLVAAIREARPGSEVRFIDTVCAPTKNRQQALRRLIEDCDTIVVVGGRNSNNTLQLVAAAAAAGRSTFHIEHADELDSAWFAGSAIVGITAGTSTLHETVAAVHERLTQIAASLHENLTTTH